MKAKELLKLIYEVKGYYTESIDSMIDFGGINLVLSKNELERLANKLVEVTEITNFSNELSKEEGARICGQ